MLSQSYDPCGKGDYGIVFNGNEGEVIKLHPKNDVGYIAFIQWVMTLTDQAYRKHFPTILYYHEQEDYVIVVMERLYHYYDLASDEQETLYSCLRPVQASPVVALDTAKQRFVYAMNLQRGRDHIFKGWDQYKVIDSLEQAMQSLLIQVYSNAWAVDLHSDNIMFRRSVDGLCAVIIDPFTWGVPSLDW